MENVITVDFRQRRRRARLTLQAGSASVMGAMPKERIAAIRASIEKVNAMMEKLRQ